MNALLDDQELGERLRLARESRGLTQAAVADRIGISRTTLVAIEQGIRRVRIDELRRLAGVYETSSNRLLRNESVHVDFTVQFRKLPGCSDDMAVHAAEVLTRLVKAEVELESILGMARHHRDIDERPLRPGSVEVQAEEYADDFRQAIGLGPASASRLTVAMEMDLGMRVYVRPLNSAISGLFAYDESVGPCILLNALHPKERRALTAAHECGHYITSRRKVEVLRNDPHRVTKEEKFADHFARSLLAPSKSVIDKFSEIVSGQGKLTRRHVIILAHYFGVSREFMVRRLEELGLVKRGTWDWFLSNGGITQQQVAQVLGDLAGDDYNDADSRYPTTLRMSSLVADAHRQGLLSEGQLSSLLGISRVEVRALIDDFDGEGNDGL